MSDLTTVRDTLELALARARDLVDPVMLGPGQETLNRVRERRGFLGDTLVLAIAGGTGSGKSSLLNALAGAPIAPTGVLRPTTDRPLAWIPQPADPGLSSLLDRLGVDQRVGHEGLEELALIDLPDHDSIVTSHRGIVEALLPEVDGVIWVVDPQKYRDPVVHEQYVVPLADYQDQFLFVLNQIDRLAAHERPVVAEDLRRVLHADGIANPRLFLTAAAPDEGTPDVEELAAHLAGRIDAKAVAMGKLVGDLRRAGRDLRRLLALDQGADLSFDSRWESVRTSLIVSLVPEADTEEVEGFEEVLCRLGDFVTALSVEAGEVFGERLRDRFGNARLEEELRGALADTGIPEPPEMSRVHGWRARLRGALREFWFGPDQRGVPDPELATVELEPVLDRRLGDPLREEMWERSLLAATLTSLEVEGRQAQEGLSR